MVTKARLQWVHRHSYNGCIGSTYSIRAIQVVLWQHIGSITMITGVYSQYYRGCLSCTCILQCVQNCSKDGVNLLSGQGCARINIISIKDLFLF